MTVCVCVIYSVCTGGAGVCVCVRIYVSVLYTSFLDSCCIPVCTSYHFDDPKFWFSFNHHFHYTMLHVNEKHTNHNPHYVYSRYGQPSSHLPQSLCDVVHRRVSPELLGDGDTIGSKDVLVVL